MLKGKLSISRGISNSNFVTTCRLLFTIFLFSSFFVIVYKLERLMSTKSVNIVQIIYSTVSSTLSGAAANGWTDILEPMFPNIPPHRAASISKCIGKLGHRMDNRQDDSFSTRIQSYTESRQTIQPKLGQTKKYICFRSHAPPPPKKKV